jgi:type IV pilus assembly protein PilM
VAFYTAIFQKAGLFLRELETEAFALERSLVGLDKNTAMVVDIGAERTNFFIIDQGLPLTHRTITVGGNSLDHILQKSLGIDLKLIQQVKRDFARNPHSMPVSIFTPILDPILKEIEYSFDLFLHETGNEGKHPEKIILTGGSAVLPFIVEEIKKKFSMKVFLGDPWARVIYQDGLKSILDDIGPRMSVAIGLALRNIV